MHLESSASRSSDSLITSEALKAITATGATLGVMAVVLVLFLFLLCLPWSKCRRLQFCFGNTRSDRSTVSIANQRAPEAQITYFPLSILDLFPPSMLPKLPDYEDCMENDDIPPPATPPSSVIARTRGRTRATGQHSSTQSQSRYSGYDSGSSTPPPAYSAVQSPEQSGQPNESSSNPSNQPSPTANSEQQPPTDETIDHPRE